MDKKIFMIILACVVLLSLVGYKEEFLKIKDILEYKSDIQIVSFYNLNDYNSSYTPYYTSNELPLHLKKLINKHIFFIK